MCSVRIRVSMCICVYACAYRKTYVYVLIKMYTNKVGCGGVHLSSQPLQRSQVGGSQSRPDPGKNERPHLKNNLKQKRAGDMTQMA
jgi:hypothetical protein